LSSHSSKDGIAPTRASKNQTRIGTTMCNAKRHGNFNITIGEPFTFWLHLGRFNSNLNLHELVWIYWKMGTFEHKAQHLGQRLKNYFLKTYLNRAMGTIT
jgi:hypothetical protein